MCLFLRFHFRRRKVGSRVGSVARAVDVQMCENWLVFPGSLSEELEPSKTIRNRHFSFLHLIFAAVLCMATQPRYESRFKHPSWLQPRTPRTRVWTGLVLCACVYASARGAACVSWHLKELIPCT